MSSRLNTAQREVQRVLKEVHDEYYASRPDPTIALRGYLDESLSLNRPEDGELDTSFEAYGADYTPTVLPSHDVDASPNGIVEIDTSAYPTIPSYRFCRPVEGTVFREMERFTTFVPAVMLDSGKYEEYREKVEFAEWLYDQPGRRPADDMITVETYRRLTCPTNPNRLGRQIIDRTRQLPLHSDIIVDMDLLRDFPPFPTSNIWSDIAVPSKEEFSDGPTAYEDMREQFCTLAGGRVYACVGHARCSRNPTLRPHTRAKDRPKSKTECSKSCWRNSSNENRIVDLSESQMVTLQSLIRNGPSISSCDLRFSWPGVTCVSIARARAIKGLNLPRSLGSTAKPRAQSCSCSKSSESGSSKRKRCQGSSCACKQARRECQPELCHPEHEIESWLDVVDPDAVDPGDTCRHNTKLMALTNVTQVRISPIAGYGLFAKENIPEGTTLFVYNGELFDSFETENRFIFYEFDRRNYLFDVDIVQRKTEISLVVDAALRGNESRFINTHLSSPAKINCTAIPWYTSGDPRLIIRTTKKIAKDEEIFLDYGDQFELNGDKGKALKQTKLKKQRKSREQD